MHGLTRRQFLEDSLLAAAAAAAAGAAAPLARAASIVDRVPSQDPLRVAVIGVHGRGQELIRWIQQDPRTVITCICDTDERVGQRCVDSLRKKQTSKTPLRYERDLRRVFDDPSIQLVAIATPNHWHALAAIWAMQAGKDVYVEKPVSHNLSEGRRIVETARRHNRICQTGTQCRSMQGSIDAVNYVHEGKIGPVKLARALCYKRRESIGPRGLYEVPASVDYNLWQGPAEEEPLTRPRFHYDWHWQYHWGNGDMGNQAPHEWDVARWGLQVEGLPQHVISYGGRLGYIDAGDVANTQVAIEQWPEKTLICEVRGLPTDALQGVKIGVIFYGAEGYVALTSYTDGAAFDLKGNLIQRFAGEGRHWNNFVDAAVAADPTKLHADILQGHLSSSLAHLATISYRLGTKLPASEIGRQLQAMSHADEAAETLARTVAHLRANDLDPEQAQLSLGPMLAVDTANEKLIDNPAANEMLTRKYRAPFIVPAAGNV